MRSLILEMPNGRELVDELDVATELMMSIPIELVGGEAWQAAFARQQQAFKQWRSYLLCKATHPILGGMRKSA
ncbi:MULTISPECIES: hypothetical protein [Pseudomonas]|uniref:hypothetical protein n=1 Tax=Pseudomonas TaxID=286 RepID=UPI000CFD39DE|nr:MULTISPECIES: hypothetical protein [Pseudomonas]PQZ89393.1 hypothetical protein CQ048_17250 [Pseudomonas trivialis]PRB25115.1 hypothetical protein CQ041_16990 [Pseudomonas sp. MYb60]